MNKIQTLVVVAVVIRIWSKNVLNTH